MIHLNKKNNNILFLSIIAIFLVIFFIFNIIKLNNKNMFQNEIDKLKYPSDNLIRVPKKLLII